MSNQNEPLQLIDSLLFPKIFQAFRMSIQPSKLIIAFLAVAAICLVGYIMDLNKTVVKSEQSELTELQFYVANPDQMSGYLEIYGKQAQRTGVFSTLWHFGTERFHNAVYSLFRFDIPTVVASVADCFKAIAWAIRYHLVYSIIFFAVILAVTSVAGGAICRIAALQFARGEKPGLTEALRFSTKKFTSFFTTPLAPIGIIIVIGFFIFLLGLVGNIPWAGELLVGIFMPLALFAGALIAALLIGTVAGFNLMFPAVAYEGEDCYDAVSRSFSYVYSKPWRMCFYTAIAVVYGAICYLFIRLFAFLLLWVTHRFLQLGILGANKKLAAIWPTELSFIKPLNPITFTGGNWPETISAFLVYVFLLAILALVVSFVINFYFSVNTIIYALMRNKVDNTALDNIYYTHSDEGGTDTTASEPEPNETQTDSETQSAPDTSSAAQ